MKVNHYNLNKLLYNTTICFCCIVVLFSFTKSFGQITYTWNPTSTDFMLAGNWLPNRNVPANTDILAFTNGLNNTVTNVNAQTIGQLLVNNNTIVTLQAASAGTSININNGPGSDLEITTGSALNIFGDNDLTISLLIGATGLITGNMTFSGALANTPHKLIAADANAIVFNSPAIFTQGFRNSSNVFGNTNPANTVIFNSGSTFIQNGGGVANANPFGLAAPASKVVFNTGSLYKQQQIGAISLTGRTYANFELNYSAANAIANGGTPTSIDNLTITAGQLNINLTGGVNIKGNILVAAGQTLTFNPASAGNVNFNGTTTQSITNMGTLNFGANESVTFNNAAGFVVNNNITFNNAVNFTSGIVTAFNPSTITLSASATVAGVSNTSFVDGLVTKVGNTPFTFPVGKSSGSFTGYVPIQISNPVLANIADSYTTEYIHQSASVLGPITATGLKVVSDLDYWSLTRTAVNPSSTVDVILNWNAQSSNNGSPNFITDVSTIVAARFNGTNWDSYGGFGTTTSATVIAGTVTWLGVNTFSLFALGSISFGNPLPINLHYLNGYKQSSSHHLNWKIGCGANNNSVTMHLERSADNFNFKTIATIFADVVRCQQPFDFTDAQPLKNINYYRLKMIDAYGKITYSASINILNKPTGFDIVGLWPNPVHTTALLNITAAKNEKIHIVVTDALGKQVYANSYNVVAGENRVAINFANLTSGTYQITGHNSDGKLKMLRIVKQ